MRVRDDIALKILNGMLSSALAVDRSNREEWCRMAYSWADKFMQEGSIHEQSDTVRLTAAQDWLLSNFRRIPPDLAIELRRIVE